MEEVSIFVNFANSFHPMIKFTCEMSSEQRYSKDLAFHLLEFSIHKPTLSTLKLFSIHTFHPATLSIRKRVLSKDKHYVSVF